MNLARLALSLGFSVHGLITLSPTKTFQVGRMLKLLAKVGDQLPNEAQASITTKTAFHVDEVPQVSIVHFYLQLSSNTGLQDEQAIVVLVLIERLCATVANNGSPLVINSHSIHR